MDALKIGPQVWRSVAACATLSIARWRGIKKCHAACAREMQAQSLAVCCLLRGQSHAARGQATTLKTWGHFAVPKHLAAL